MASSQGTFEHILCLESKCSTYIQISPLKLNKAQVQVITDLELKQSQNLE